MTVNIITGFETLYNVMIGCLEAENVTDGLLEDVLDIVNMYYSEASVDEPCIWVTQHPTTPIRQADISQTMELQTPFEFDCAVYDNDLDDANVQSQNLANRVVLAVLNNWQTIQSELLPGQRMIKNITFNTYSPVGYVNVKGKSDRVPVTGVILNVHHIINWKMYCQQYNNGE